MSTVPIAFIPLRGDEDEDDNMTKYMDITLMGELDPYALKRAALELDRGSSNETARTNNSEPPEFVFFLSNTMLLGLNTFFWRGRISEDGDSAAVIAFHVFLIGGWLCWLPACLSLTRRRRCVSSETCTDHEGGPDATNAQQVPGPLLLLIFFTAAMNMVIGTCSINHSNVSGTTAFLEKSLMLVGWLCLLAAFVYFVQRQRIATPEFGNF